MDAAQVLGHFTIGHANICGSRRSISFLSRSDVADSNVDLQEPYVPNVLCFGSSLRDSYGTRSISVFPSPS